MQEKKLLAYLESYERNLKKASLVGGLNPQPLINEYSRYLTNGLQVSLIS